MRELILASPAAESLLPLTTALEREMGLEPRVPKEVEEVAKDIQKHLAKLRGSSATLDNPAFTPPATAPSPSRKPASPQPRSSR